MLDLEDIRVSCNMRFYEVLSERAGSKAKAIRMVRRLGANPSLAILTMTADADNRILQGEDPSVVYGIYEGMTPELVMERALSITRNELADYLAKD